MPDSLNITQTMENPAEMYSELNEFYVYISFQVHSCETLCQKNKALEKYSLSFHPPTLTILDNSVRAKLHFGKICLAETLPKFKQWLGRKVTTLTLKSNKATTLILKRKFLSYLIQKDKRNSLTQQAGHALEWKPAFDVKNEFSWWQELNCGRGNRFRVTFMHATFYIES